MTLHRTIALVALLLISSCFTDSGDGCVGNSTLLDLTECDIDDDCPTGEICSSGLIGTTCDPAETCTFDGDCEEDWVCDVRMPSDEWDEPARKTCIYRPYPHRVDCYDPIGPGNGAAGGGGLGGDGGLGGAGGLGGLGGAGGG